MHAGWEDEITCVICGSPEDEAHLLLCDGCPTGHYHTTCLTPPLMRVPDGLWLCPACNPAGRAIAQVDLSLPTKLGAACNVCGSSSTARTIRCRGCEEAFHATCLGLHRNAFPAGEFVCAHCTLLASKVITPSEAAAQAAHTVVFLSGHRVANSSMDTYASAMHRFIVFVTEHCGMSIRDALPAGSQGVVSTDLVRLFIGYAASKYKVSTIRVTLAALVDWHKSKGADHASVSPAHPDIRPLLTTLENHAGPAGLPQGKQGMSRELLLLTLRHVHAMQSTDRANAQLYLRDWNWLALGYFGMFRRSELVALKLSDVTIHTTPTPHITLRIRKSKADQRGAGATVTLVAITRDHIRLADKLSELLTVRKQNGAGPSDPLFPSWDLDTRTLSRTAALSSGQALAKRLTLYLTTLAKTYNVSVNPQSYGMHSLRRGGVVAAWAAKLDLERIKSHGRWRSSAVNAYLVADLPIRLSVSAAM
jgi:integrase